MSDDHHSHLVCGELLHDVQHFTDHLRIKRRSRLVEQHNLRLHRQRPHDRHTLLLSTGKLLRIGLRLVLKPNPFEKFKGFGLSLVARHLPDKTRGERNIVQYGKVREEVEMLKHHPHLAAHAVLRLLVGAYDIHAVEVDMATRRDLQ